MPRGRVLTGEVEEASVVVVFTVVAAGLGQPEAVSVAVAAELRTSQAGRRASEAEARASQAELACHR